MEASQTANQMYSYDMLFYGTPLDTWVQDAHRHNCEIGKWEYAPLKKGAFGYDNLAVSIGYALSNYVYDDDAETTYILADLIHQGWCMNYVFWRDHKPYAGSTQYIAPYNPLGDERRNMCAETEFYFLDREEQDKDFNIADLLYEKIEEWMTDRCVSNCHSSRIRSSGSGTSFLSHPPNIASNPQSDGMMWDTTKSRAASSTHSGLEAEEEEPGRILEDDAGLFDSDSNSEGGSNSTTPILDAKPQEDPRMQNLIAVIQELKERISVLENDMKVCNTCEFCDNIDSLYTCISCTSKVCLSCSRRIHTKSHKGEPICEVICHNCD
jgi:hypothetical protein